MCGSLRAYLVLESSAGFPGSLKVGPLGAWRAVRFRKGLSITTGPRTLLFFWDTRRRRRSPDGLVLGPLSFSRLGTLRHAGPFSGRLWVALEKGGGGGGGQQGTSAGWCLILSQDVRQSLQALSASLVRTR